MAEESMEDASSIHHDEEGFFAQYDEYDDHTQTLSKEEKKKNFYEHAETERVWKSLGWRGCIEQDDLDGIMYLDEIQFLRRFESAIEYASMLDRPFIVEYLVEKFIHLKRDPGDHIPYWLKVKRDKAIILGIMSRPKERIDYDQVIDFMRMHNGIEFLVLTKAVKRHFNDLAILIISKIQFGKKHFKSLILHCQAVKNEEMSQYITQYIKNKNQQES